MALHTATLYLESAAAAAAKIILHTTTRTRTAYAPAPVSALVPVDVISNPSATPTETRAAISRQARASRAQTPDSVVDPDGSIKQVQTPLHQRN